MTKATHSVSKRKPTLAKQVAKLSAKQVLAMLREYFAYRNAPWPRRNTVARRQAWQQERKELWDVLTALRGPDNDDSHLKYATTAVIRWHVFGEDSAVGEYAIMNPDLELRASFRQDKISGHFSQHAQQAFAALGLSWNYNNHDDHEKGA